MNVVAPTAGDGLAAEAPIVLAPFTNERIREWPLESFRRFIEVGVEDGRRFIVSGGMAHRPLANELVRPFPANLVANRAGTTSWDELQGILKAAPFVVANNSGIAHLAASLGQWVLCVFSGSHMWLEWMPRGPKVVTIARMPPCAPCVSPVCPNNLACLSGVSPAMAYEEINAAIREGALLRRSQPVSLLGSA